MFQSPQWGNNSKGIHLFVITGGNMFQSPQWGNNSKVSEIMSFIPNKNVSVPAMGK